MDDAVDGDFSCSRAVLIGTWDFTDPQLPDIPAARHSLDRFAAMLTGPLGRWPKNRVRTVANRRSADDFAHELVETFVEATDVALFYYVGHGQYDDEDRLCLALGESRHEDDLRTTTSLTFDEVRHAFRRSNAKTKIAILDCCSAGSAVARAGRLGEAAALPRAPGIYLMMASGEYLPAMFQSAEETPRPETYFTKYLVDVIDRGIPGQPAGLTLGPIFDHLARALARDHRPEPHRLISDRATGFVFARNAAGPEPGTVSSLVPPRDISSHRGFRDALAHLGWRWRQVVSVVAVVVTVPIVVTAVVLTVGYSGGGAGRPSDAVIASGPVTLAFTGVNTVTGLAVDAASDVYVADSGHSRVLRLAAGSSVPTTLPFTGLSSIAGLAVDAGGDVYLADAGNYRVLRLAAGSSTQTVLPFTGSDGGLVDPPGAVAVDAAGDVYVAYSGHNWVMRLAAGSTAPTILPFVGFTGIRGLAVAPRGDAYVVGSDDVGGYQVSRLAAGSSNPTTVPFTDMAAPIGICVDTAGDVYLADSGHDRVLRLAAGSSNPSVLSSTELITIGLLAVNASGTTLYAADESTTEVVEAQVTHG